MKGIGVGARVYRFWLRSVNWKHSSFPAFHDFIVKCIVFIIGVAATYYLAPNINHHFENERRRTAYYAQAIENLSNETKILLGRLTRLSYSSNRDEKFIDLNREEIAEIVTRLHWRSIEYALIFDDSEFTNAVKEYQLSLSSVSDRLAPMDIGSDAWRKMTEDLARSSARIVLILGKRANVS